MSRIRIHFYEITSEKDIKTNQYSESMQCVVCTEEMCNKKRKPILCMHCAFQACRCCYEKYFLNVPVTQCMTCNKPWTRAYVVNQFSKFFVNGALKLHREEILYEREKALLPSSQKDVVKAIEEENVNDQLSMINSMMRELQKRKTALQQSLTNSEFVVSKGLFLRGCPHELCRGYLNEKWTCGLCEVVLCSHCFVIKQDGHVCKDEDKETARLLKLNTKPCPQCSTGIYKIDGCDQMWCTECHTGFSWRTGAIETKLHNPHYYEFLRRTEGHVPREEGDRACNRELDYYFCRKVHKVLLSCTGLNRKGDVDKDVTKNVYFSVQVKELYDRMMMLVQCCNHLDNVERPRFAVNAEENNVSLRVEYLRNRLTEEEFKTKIQRSNKAYERKKEIYEILSLFCESARDILYRAVENVKEIPREDVCSETHRVLDEIHAICDYSNQCLFEISVTYESKLKYICLWTNDSNRSVLQRMSTNV